ncbi:MAG: proline dehydrogenase family protein [Cyclobacteriaceae bacterium]
MQTASLISFDDTSIAFEAKSDKALRKANLMFSVVNNPLVNSVATNLAKAALALHLPIKPIIKNTVFEHFCGGETIEESQDTIDELAAYGIGTILDYSVEGGETEEGFNKTRDEILRIISYAKDHKDIPFCVFKPTGLVSTPLLEKIQAKKKLSEKEKEAFNRARERVETICRAAFEADIPILIDAEESWIQDPIDAMVYAMMAKFNKKRAIVYNTFQMYRVDMLDNLRKAFHYAAMHNYFLGAKLVRGAYMEKERERAEEQNYPSPIQPTKQATDDSYNKALSFCIDNKQRVSLINGSHNEYSNYYLTVLMEKHSMPNNDPRVWFSQLYGMSDNISFNLSKAGYNVCKYVPYGPVRSVMPYLFRRAKENTAVAGQSSRELSMIRREIERRRVSDS